jgi:nicotinamidase-related amidase
MALDINKKSTALVVIDLQKGIAAMDRQLAPYSAQKVIENAAKLADAFRKNNMPVFLVHVMFGRGDSLNLTVDDNPWASRSGPPAPDFADIVPELGPKENDIVITKKQWGAFYGTELELQLRRRKIDTIVLCGIATNYGVESTARFAYESGYEQIFVEDATSSMSKEIHDLSIDHVFKRMGRVRKTDEILSSL